VDQEQALKGLMDELISSTRDLPLVFPVHPRSAKMLKTLGIAHERLYMTEPLGYLEFYYVVERSKAVVTDSGRITEETTVLGIPCMTLRDTTERPETVTIGTIVLLGTKPAAIRPAMEKLFSGECGKRKHSRPVGRPCGE